MLDTKEKQRILQEEQYRSEVRHQLEDQKPLSKSKKIWLFVNSNFGIWLLSTVIIGLATFFYGRIQANSDHKKANDELKRKLDLEISNRVNNIYKALKLVADNNDLKPGSFRVIYYATLGVDDEGTDNYIFNEYKSRTTKSILFEYDSTLDEEERKKFKEASKKINLILVGVSDMINQINQSSETANPSGKKAIEYKSKLIQYKSIIEKDLILKEYIK